MTSTGAFSASSTSVLRSDLELECECVMFLGFAVRFVKKLVVVEWFNFLSLGDIASWYLGLQGIK
jgi:hypothetical protein